MIVFNGLLVLLDQLVLLLQLLPHHLRLAVHRVYQLLLLLLLPVDLQHSQPHTLQVVQLDQPG